MMNRSWFREITIPLVSEEIAALLQDPASFKCKPDCPQDHPWHAKKNSDETDTVELDSAGEKRDKSGKWTVSGADHKRLTKAGYKPHKVHADGMHTYKRKEGDYAHVDPDTGSVSMTNKVDRYRAASSEIAALFGNPHDVSGEARDKGQFSKTPGAGAAAQPTGSPLDPATGAKPPPKPSDQHKERYDAHTTAAKTYHDLVKQHINLAKIALSPEDRARHIKAAQGHKQSADSHIQQAEQHALAHGQAIQKETAGAIQADPTAGGTMSPPLGQWKPQPAGGPTSATAYQNSQMPGRELKGAELEKAKQRYGTGAAPAGPPVVPPDTSDGEGTLPSASQQPGAQQRPPGTGGYQGKPGGPLEKWQARKAADPLDKTQQMPAVRPPTFAPSGEKPSGVTASPVGAQRWMGAAPAAKPVDDGGYGSPSWRRAQIQGADQERKAQEAKRSAHYKEITARQQKVIDAREKRNPGQGMTGGGK